MKTRFLVAEVASEFSEAGNRSTSQLSPGGGGRVATKSVMIAKHSGGGVAHGDSDPAAKKP